MPTRIPKRWVWHPSGMQSALTFPGGRSLGCLGTTTGYHLASLRDATRSKLYEGERTLESALNWQTRMSALHSWVGRTLSGRRGSQTLRNAGHERSRPSLRDLCVLSENPRLKSWAIVGRPAGTEKS